MVEEFLFFLFAGVLGRRFISGRHFLALMVWPERPLSLVVVITTENNSIVTEACSMDFDDLPWLAIYDMYSILN